MICIFQSQHKWLDVSNLTLSSWDTSHDKNISVILSGIQLQTCYWNISGLKLSISKSLLPKMTLTIGERKKNHPHSMDNLPVILHNSTVEHLIGSCINLLVFGVFIIGPRQSNKPVFLLESSTIDIINSRFHGINVTVEAIESAAVLYIDNCQAKVKSSHFSSNSVFAGTISSENSRISVSNCKFQQNQGTYYGGALFMIQSNVSLMSSEFKWNKAIQGGALSIQDRSNLTIDNCTFYSNKATGENAGLSMVKLKLFRRNAMTAQPSPVIHWHGDLDIGNITLTGDRFTNQGDGVQGNGGAIFGDWNVTITITQSQFIVNTGADGLGGAIYVMHSTQLEVHNSSFTNNTAFQGGAIEGQQNITITITQSQFRANSCVGGAISVGWNSQLEVHSSSFINNTAFQGGAINLAQNVNAIFTNTCFITNSASEKIIPKILNEDTQQLANERKIELNENMSSSDKTQYNNRRKEQLKYANFHGSGSNKRKTLCRNESHPFKQVFIRSNDVSPMGGAILAHSDVMIHIQTSKFINNTAAGGDGGALCAIHDVTLHIEDSVFDGNSAVQGGAMDVYLNITMRMKNVKLSNNHANKGGLVAERQTDLHIINCTFLKNSAQKIGALFVGGMSNYAVTNSLFINNTGYQDVGTINVQGGSTGCIMRCNFSGNTGAEGSDIGVVQSVINISHVSFTNVSPNIIHLTLSSQLYMYACNIQNNSFRRSTQGNDDIFLIEISQHSHAHITGCNIMYNDFHGIGFVHLTASIFNIDKSNIMYNSLGVNFKVESGFLSMKNCNASFNNISNNGSLITLAGSRIFMYNCRVNNNLGARWGGVIYSDSGNISIWNSSFLFNSAKEYGGVISLYSSGYSSLSVVNTLFHHNHAEARGAVIHTQYLETNILIDISLDSCNFTKNTAQTDSALFVDGCSSLRTSRCYFKSALDSMDTQCSIYFGYYYTDYLTYRTQFHSGDRSLDTSQVDFLQKAISDDIVYVDSQGEPFIVTNEETPYSAGK